MQCMESPWFVHMMVVIIALTVITMMNSIFHQESYSTGISANIKVRQTVSLISLCKEFENSLFSVIEEQGHLFTVTDGSLTWLKIRYTTISLLYKLSIEHLYIDEMLIGRCFENFLAGTI